MEAIKTLKDHSSRLRRLEHNFDHALHEVRALLREVEAAVQEIQMNLPEDVVHPPRSESPFVLQPLSPPPRLRRARSTFAIGKV
jgi:hypothetical protein